MNMNAHVRLLRIWIVGLLVAMVAACGRPTATDAAGEANAEQRSVVMTSFDPLTYFAQRIGAGTVIVRCPVPADADPSLWQPTPEDVAEMQNARLVLINGASFEGWVATTPLARSRVVDTSAALADEFLKYEHAVTHSHGPGGAHSHEGINGHTWLDPISAIVQAQAVRDALETAFPEHEAAFTRACAELVADLRRLDAELKSLTPRMEDVTVICSHPAYDYIGRRYGWHILNVNIPPDEPMNEAAAASIESANLRPRRVVLWESGPLDLNVEQLRQRFDAASAVFSPCESPGDQDYLERMRANIGRLADALGDG